MGATRTKTSRPKLSTTVARETIEFLEAKIESGEAANLAEALDMAIVQLSRWENRARLALATARYFEELDARAREEEGALAGNLMSAAGGIDFDQER